MGPTVSKDSASGSTPSAGTSPSVGRKPAKPVTQAGARTEPKVSVPSAAAANPAATAAALPLLDPAALRARL